MAYLMRTKKNNRKNTIALMNESETNYDRQTTKPMCLPSRIYRYTHANQEILLACISNFILCYIAVLLRHSLLNQLIRHTVDSFSSWINGIRYAWYGMINLCNHTHARKVCVAAHVYNYLCTHIHAFTWINTFMYTLYLPCSHVIQPCYGENDIFLIRNKKHVC